MHETWQQWRRTPAQKIVHVYVEWHGYLSELYGDRFKVYGDIDGGWKFQLKSWKKIFEKT